MKDITLLSYDEFHKSIITRNANDELYEANGYIIANHGEQFAIARFGHCSCYDTYSALSESRRAPGIAWDWIGSLEELLKMARYKLDPHWALGGSRKAKPDDYDYQYLMACYKDVLKWNRNQQK